MWQFLLLLLLLLMLGIVKSSYPQQFGLIFKLLYRKNYAEEFFTFQLKRSTAFSFLLHSIFNISIAWSFYYLVPSTHVFDLEGPIKFLFLLIGIIAFKEIKEALNLFLGWLLDLPQLSTRFVILKKMHYLIGGILMIPLVALAAYGHPIEIFWQQVAFGFAAILLAIASIRASYLLAKELKFYYVYVILYFCALEITPVALIVKSLSDGL